ncbi:MAG: hypothetical protein KHY96_01425 [Lachnospiraceae bacterium]|nr:hypothetical protein [Lachnospiraceae bacterium]
MKPLMMIGQMMKNGGNPQQIFQQMMRNNQIVNNPMAKNAMEMLQKGDSSGLQSMAENLAKERGTTIENIRNEVMKQFGMN